MTKRMYVWNAQALCELVDSSAVETLTLELKSDIPGRADRDRAEFLKDVSAMANASGGSILYGISELNGRASSFSGLKFIDADAEIRRLSQILEGGIEPRLTGVVFATAPTSSGDVLILHVPESFDSPHRYVFNGHSKFVQRMGTHISELSYNQLRTAFDRSSTRLESLRAAWREDVSLKATWKPMLGGPVCVVRLSPLVSADGRQVIDPKSAYDHWSQLILPNWGGGSSSFNYQGLAVYPGGHGELPALVQVHRNGAISAFRTGKVLFDDSKLIPSVAVGDFFIDSAKRLLNFANVMGVAGASILQMGIVRVNGYALAVRDRHGFDEHLEADVSEILMPEFWIEDLSQIDSVDQIVRSGFDLIWQSFGRAECPFFNTEGMWSPRR